MAKNVKKNTVSQRVPLPGSFREIMPNSRPAGPINPAEIASITVRTRSNTAVEKLEKHVGDIYSKPLATRNYLTREEAADLFGAKEKDMNDIEHFAQSHNLQVSHRNKGERSLVLTGRLDDIQRAFPANLHMFHHVTGTYRGRQGEILIPKQFENIITGIFGFDTRPKRRVPHRNRFMAHDGPGGPNGVSAMEFAKRYNFPTQFNGKKLDGAGQCIAIIELGGGFNNSDLQIFFREINSSMPKSLSEEIMLDCIAFSA